MGSNLAKIVLVVEYDGTAYCGFQYQDNGATIQSEIEKAIKKLTGETLRIVGSSRTDSGVHARGQTVCFRSESGLKTENYISGLNHFLPVDIAVKAAYSVSDSFNVQKEASSRIYHYRIYNGATRSPLEMRYSYYVSGELDSGRMNAACALLVGRHDMASFVTDAAQSVIKSTLKTIFSAMVKRESESLTFVVEGNSFLPHQVRNTVGALLKVGQEKMSVDDFKRIMEAKKPGLAGPTAPAQGLYLMKVVYPRPLGEYHEDLHS